MSTRELACFALPFKFQAAHVTHFEVVTVVMEQTPFSGTPVYRAVDFLNNSDSFPQLTVI